MLSIGEISYLNCTPIFSTLRDRFADPLYRFVRGAPAELNRRLRMGEIDICPSSSIEYARNPGAYLIVPDISIAAIGPVKSVLLLSPLPIEELDGRDIALTGESETSVVLLKVLLARRYGFANSFRSVPVAAQLGLVGKEPLLLIGDNALRAALTADCPYIYDLGRLWFEFTGLPFVFALWLARRAAVEKERALFMVLTERLMLSKRLFLDNPAALPAESFQNNWTNREFIINYWKSISYDLDESHQQGLRLFYRLAVETGLLESEPPLCLLA
jgi:chorismate dehydratase